jgi:CRISPR-associated Cas5-like protein
MIDTERLRPVAAARIELFAPVASFRDPMFPGTTRCLPVPPPATLRGMLAAATGREAERLALGVCAHAEGGGVDAETYHPVAADGSNPAVAGRVAPVKGGMTIRDRPFLSGVHVTMWIPDPDAERIAAALRRPVWGLRLGRSQDLVHIRAISAVMLQAAEEAVVGHALAPPGGHADPRGATLQLPSLVSNDRLTTTYGEYLWCAEPAGRQPVAGAYRDGDQAVWLHTAAPASAGGDPDVTLAAMAG